MHSAVRALAVSLAVTLPSAVVAQTSVRTESRDAAFGFIGTMNFTVGRLGAECLAMTGRTESPQQLVQAWQMRNSRFVLAAAKYGELMLEEVRVRSGEAHRNAVVQEVSAIARSSGAATVKALLRGDSREEACRKALALVDGGALDVTPRVPIYAELEALVEWSR